MQRNRKVCSYTRKTGNENYTDLGLNRQRFNNRLKANKVFGAFKTFLFPSIWISLFSFLKQESWC